MYFLCRVSAENLMPGKSIPENPTLKKSIPESFGLEALVLKSIFGRSK